MAVFRYHFLLFFIAFLSTITSMAYAAKPTVVRNYNAPFTEVHKENIFYIVSTLGSNKSLRQILKEKGALEKAGDKIDEVHPLRFLMYVFSEEELKAAMANLKAKSGLNSMPWKKFKKGLFESLTDEYEKNNITPEFIADFAANLGIDPTLIIPAIQENDWDKLLSLLIKLIPRQGNYNRYNI